MERRKAFERVGGKMKRKIRFEELEFITRFAIAFGVVGFLISLGLFIAIMI